MASKIVWNGLIVVGAIVAGLAVSNEPSKELRKQNGLAAKHVEEMREAESRYAEDLRRQAKLSGDSGLEPLARKQGWHKPDEIVVAPQ